MSTIALVVARAANGVIGAQGGIPWHISEDMRRFRDLTTGKPCIMGRRTWESLPKKPLPERLNIVVTSDYKLRAPGAIIARSFDDAVARAGPAPEIAVIGGAGIYRAALPRAEIIYLTEVHAEFAGDVFFPDLARKEWREISREDRVSADGLRYAFVTLERILTGER